MAHPSCFVERLIPQKAALCTSELMSHKGNVSKPMERQKAMGVSALGKQDEQLTRKEIYSMFMYWLFKRGMQKPRSLASLVICTAGFACFMVSVPPGPGRPKCLFSVIIALFTLEVNSFTDCWWQKQLAREQRLRHLFSLYIWRKNCTKVPGWGVNERKVQVQTKR